MSTIFLSSCSARTDGSLTASPDEDFVVQPFYVIPADQDYFPEYEAAIRELVIEIQQWYLQRAGVTFRLAPLQVVRAQLDYLTMRGGLEPTEKFKQGPQHMTDMFKGGLYWAEALKKAVGGLRPRQVAWFFAQGGGGWAGANLIGEHSGYGIFGDWVLEPITGVENPKGLPAKFATWQVQGGVPKGTTAHELGHAFGLHHPPKLLGKSIMSWHGDYPDTGLLPHEILILQNSPFFNKDAFDKAAPHCQYETQDSARQGDVLGISGGPFRDGDLIEFVDAENRWKVMPFRLEPGLIQAKVPAGIGPGFVRVWRGDLRSNIVPVNFILK